MADTGMLGSFTEGLKNLADSDPIKALLNPKNIGSEVETLAHAGVTAGRLASYVESTALGQFLKKFLPMDKAPELYAGAEMVETIAKAFSGKATTEETVGGFVDAATTWFTIPTVEKILNSVGLGKYASVIATGISDTVIVPFMKKLMDGTIASSIDSLLKPDNPARNLNLGSVVNSGSTASRGGSPTTPSYTPPADLAAASANLKP